MKYSARFKNVKTCSAFSWQKVRPNKSHDFSSVDSFETLSPIAREMGVKFSGFASYELKEKKKERKKKRNKERKKEKKKERSHVSFRKMKLRQCDQEEGMSRCRCDRADRRSK
jgi:hypothetical protein